MNKLQILCLGAPKTGKTTLCNYFADLQNTLLIEEYHPTQGVRILEFQKELDKIYLNVELWDCSGDSRFLSIWKSLNGVKGIILVTDGKDQLLDYIDAIPILDPKKMVIFNNIIGNASKQSFKAKSKALKKVNCTNTCLDQNPAQVNNDFIAFLSRLYAAGLEEQRKVESAIAS